MAEGTIEIRITRDDAKKLPVPQKLDILLDLGFNSDAEIKKVNKVLHGNGEPGLCSTVRSNCSDLGHLWKCLWAILSILAVAAVTVIFAAIK